MCSINWETIGFVAGLIAAWSVLIVSVLRSMLKNNCDAIETNIEDKLSGLEKIVEKHQSLERQILELKADLPLNYVRKEDFIRHEVVINTKLDRLRDLIEALSNNNWRGKNGE